MQRPSFRVVPVALLVAQLAACSGGASFAPSARPAASAGKTTPATFTIKWTSASASASVRRRDTISPSAQSVAVLINGTVNATANRTANPTQTIALNAPVGADLFVFNVYDGLNGQGNLLGSASVAQTIIDGAANTITAAIQAVCSATNVQYAAGSDPLVYVTSATSGLFAASVQSIVLAGQSSATLIIEPEDVDGDVIISGTSGRVAAQITGSATITPIDGAHISLTPLTGPRKTSPDTLTVAAPTCPSAALAVQHSPAIYVENTAHTVLIEDWYGDPLGTGTLAGADVLAGYNTATQQIMAYNPITGEVDAYSLNLTSHSALYQIAIDMTSAWSNYAGGIFGIQPQSGSVDLDLYLYHGATQTNEDGNGVYVSATFAAASSTFAATPKTFYANGSFEICVVPLPAFVDFNCETPINNIVSLATDDNIGKLYAFGSNPPYVTQFNQSFGAIPVTGSYGFAAAPAVGAADTDGDNVYAVLSTGVLAAASSTGTALTGFTSPAVGTGLAITVLSTNEQ